MPGKPAAWKNAFLDKHRLDASYLRYAQSWFDPLAESLLAHQNGASAVHNSAPLLVGLNGSQGSGKSTTCDYLRAYLQAVHDIRALVLSLDDFYLSRARRRELAHSVHPLLATRGVPGTHDIPLLNATLDALLSGPPSAEVPVPRFDKARDDRHLRSRWDLVEGRIDVILLEGWCLGVAPQSTEQLLQPVNKLETEEDPDAFWRSYANDAIKRDFLPLYKRIDHWIMLAAPSFDCVYQWRLEQELKLADTVGDGHPAVMSDQAVRRFVQFYQRLTEYCLDTLPDKVDYLFRLDDQRNVLSVRHPGANDHE